MMKEMAILLLDVSPSCKIKIKLFKFSQVLIFSDLDY